MPADQFFHQDLCDRCGGKLVARTMSWFNEDTICMTCSQKEDEIRKTLPENGRYMEGRGLPAALDNLR